MTTMLIALGVTGGIGAYKAVEVARGLQKRGHEVVAVMTEHATRFVGAITFESITRRRVITDQFEAGANADIEHIALASTIDLLLIAPATANMIGKLANGIADDFLSTLYLATTAPVLIAPAMNTQMLAHAAVRANLDTLAARGVRFVEPGEGFLACGWIGKGRLAEPDEIVAAAEQILRPQGPLRGQRVLVTAGPTYEDFDPVRYLGNRSSGRMGFAIAAEATRRGAEVALVAGPSPVEPPAVRELVRVRTADEMYAAVIERADGVDVVVMAAAVADYTPAEPATHKVLEERGDADGGLEEDARHSGRARPPPSRGGPRSGAGRVRGGNQRRRRSRRRQAAGEACRSHRRQRRLALATPGLPSIPTRSPSSVPREPRRCRFRARRASRRRFSIASNNWSG